jgi:hypothetical protein
MFKIDTIAKLTGRPAGHQILYRSRLRRAVRRCRIAWWRSEARRAAGGAGGHLKNSTRNFRGRGGHPASG